VSGITLQIDAEALRTLALVASYPSQPYPHSSQFRALVEEALHSPAAAAGELPAPWM
jgi:hypothetical protein